MEYLDIRDLQGNCTGEVKERRLVHRDGDLHGTSHVFIVRKNESRIEVLLQKRAEEKDSYPGCYDISSAGHIPAGQDYLESALRELEEELGIKALESDLTELGVFSWKSEEDFYGEPFINHEISRVYLYQKEIDIRNLKLQKEEISSVKWFSIEECFEAIEKNDKRFCLFREELEMIQKFFIETIHEF